MRWLPLGPSGRLLGIFSLHTPKVQFICRVLAIGYTVAPQLQLVLHVANTTQTLLEKAPDNLEWDRGEGTGQL